MLIANYKLVKENDVLRLEEIDCNTKRRNVPGYSYVQSYIPAEGCIMFLISAADEKQLELAKNEILRVYAPKNA